uniref:Fatty acid synthase beta subunit AflB /Fas1-like central domain-containing protein n=1 Tax=Peronospora matthiolae TaxID=2874970 RepID=A0AAV1U147_9STRA
MMPSMNVMLQWTASRVVSSLSPEDFHEPMEVTHAAICRVPNVLLVVGSGMPVNNVFMGSFVIVANEAAAVPEVKQLLVDPYGLSPSWSGKHAIRALWTA